MKDNKYECQEYTIHFIKTEKFHTIDFSIIFTENVDKRKVTFHNTLIDVMSICTKQYDTTQKLIRKCQELYSIKPIMYDLRMGNLLKTKFALSIVNSKYVDKKIILDNILLLKEIVLNPYVSKDGFDKEKVEVAKRQVSADLDLVIENPRVYANYKSLDIIKDDANYNLTNYIDKDILEEVNSKSLYESYLDMIHHSKIDIMIAGNVSNEEEIVKFIKDNFYFNHEDIKLNDPYSYHEVTNQKPVEEKETQHFAQSKISMVYKLCNASLYENKYVLNLFTSILGGNANGLLVKSMRGDKSLCYYAGAYHNKLDNILVINSGIDAKNYERVVELIQKVFIKIGKGEFTTEDIKTAKTGILDDLNGLINTNQGIAEYFYSQEIFKGDDIKTRKEKLKNVSKKEIMDLAKKFELASLYFLEGNV